MRLAPLVLVLAVGGLTACAGPESDFLDGPPPSTAAAPTTVPVVPDTPVATSVAIASTEPVTTPEPFTTPPAPALSEPALTVTAGPPTEAEIRAALDPLYAAWRACWFDPATCDSATFIVDGTAFASRVQESSREWASAGKYFEPHPETTYSIEKILVGTSDLVNVTVCYIDFGWLRETNSTPEYEDDTVLDDRTTAYRSEATLRRLLNGDFLFEDYSRVGAWPREASCPAA